MLGARRSRRDREPDAHVLHSRTRQLVHVKRLARAGNSSQQTRPARIPVAAVAACVRSRCSPVPPCGSCCYFQAAPAAIVAGLQEGAHHLGPDRLECRGDPAARPLDRLGGDCSASGGARIRPRGRPATALHDLLLRGRRAGHQLPGRAGSVPTRPATAMAMSSCHRPVSCYNSQHLVWESRPPPWASTSRSESNTAPSAEGGDGSPWSTSTRWQADTASTFIAVPWLAGSRSANPWTNRLTPSCTGAGRWTWSALRGRGRRRSRTARRRAHGAPGWAAVRDPRPSRSPAAPARRRSRPSGRCRSWRRWSAAGTSCSPSGDVADDLRPEAALGAAADGDEPRRRVGRRVRAARGSGGRRRRWPRRRRGRGARGRGSGVSPAITPRACGSKIGVRSPAKYGSTSRPSAPGGGRGGLGDELLEGRRRR